MKTLKISSCYGASFLLGIVLIGTVLTTSCKKKDTPMDDMNMNNTSSPVLTTAVYVADEDDGTVSVIDPAQGKKVYTIHLTESMTSMLMPHNVQVAPDGKTVWVTGVPETEGAMEQVIVIDQTTNKVIKRIDAGTEQHLAHVVLDNTSTYAYVTCNESNQVIQIDAKSYAEIKRFDLDTAHKPHGLRYSQGKLYVANMIAKSMSIINVADGQITEIPLGGIAVQTAITPDGNFVFISLYDTKEVIKYDVQSQLITRISLPTGSHGPIQMYPTPNNNLLYICDQGVVGSEPASNKVYVLDINSSTIINTIIAGYAAHGVVVSNDGNTAYVTNSLSNTVSVINVATQTVTNTITVGNSPNGISYRFPTGGMP